MKDPYKVLGVDKNTSQADLKKTYRKLAMKLHPDQNPGDEKVAEQFKEVSAAYALLSDEKMKARYDRGEINADGSEKGFYKYRQNAGGNPYGGGFGGGRGGGGGNPFGSGFDAEDLFSSIFGGMGGGGGPRSASGRSRAGTARKRGKDKTYTISIDFLDAVLGSKKQIKLDNGKTLNINTPVNVKEGQQIRLKGQGLPGTGGGSNGDALIEVNIKKHPYFTRNGNDILIDLPITLEEAVMGAKVTVPALTGKIALRVPKHSSSGKTMRLKEKGAMDPKTKKRGDLLVKLQIMLLGDNLKGLENTVKKWESKDKEAEIKKIRGHLD